MSTYIRRLDFELAVDKADCLTACRSGLSWRLETSAMPLYEYDCPKCGRFEVLQKMSDKPLSRHDCGTRVQKVMSASAFSFKGSGFYVTDYKKSGNPAPACDKPKSEACASCPSKDKAAA